VCYADDTLVIAGEEGGRAKLGAANVAENRGQLCERVRAGDSASEAIFVYDRRRGPPSSAIIQMGTTTVQVGLQMKYLGLTIDRFESSAQFSFTSSG